MDHTAVGLYLCGDQIALLGIQLQTFLAADFERFHEIFCIFRLAKHVVEPDEQVQVREECLYIGLEVRNEIRYTVKNESRLKTACGMTVTPRSSW